MTINNHPSELNKASKWLELNSQNPSIYPSERADADGYIFDDVEGAKLELGIIFGDDFDHSSVKYSADKDGVHFKIISPKVNLP